MNKHLRIIGLSNELPGAGKPLVIPFGSYPHKVGKVLQLINEHTVGLMVADFNSRKSVPGFKGLPVYIGHPDVKAFFDKYTDHRSYGWVVDMYANEIGLVMEVDWTEPGAELIANEHFAYYSPNWFAYRNGADKADPFKIKSIGLTQEPMIEYLALACEDGEDDEVITHKENIMNKLLERLLALLPEKVQENVKTEDDVVSFFQKMLDGFKALRESQQERWKAEDAAYMALENEDLMQGFADYLEQITEDAASELALANEAVPETATATITQLNEEVQLANEDLATLQKAHRGVLLDVALQDGRITPATRSKWDERFDAEGADFMALANELSSIDPVMKTRRTTDGLNPEAGEQSTHADLRTASMALANEKGIDYSDAYRTCKKQEQFAHLFTEE